MELSLTMPPNAPLHPDQHPQPFRFSLKWLFVAFTLATCIIAIISWRNRANQKHEREVEERKKVIAVLLQSAVQEVELLQRKIGYAPKDVEEVETLLGHPLPQMPVSRLYYEQHGTNGFYLIFPIEWVEGFSGDFLLYDSSRPNAGWTSQFD